MSCTTIQPWLDDLTVHGDALRGGVTLPRDQTMAFVVTAGTVITCDRGSVWLTPGDGQDVELHAGKRFVATQTAKAVVWAMEDAAIVVD